MLPIRATRRRGSCRHRRSRRLNTTPHFAHSIRLSRLQTLYLNFILIFYTVKMSKTFNYDLDMKLIKTVKKYPNLFDPTHIMYSDFNFKDMTWVHIAQEMDIPAKLCKVRWTNMKDTFRKGLKNENRKAKYKYEKEMAFMAPLLMKNDANKEQYTSEDDSLPITKVEVNVASEEEYDYVDSSACSVATQQNVQEGTDAFLATVGSTLKQLNPYLLNQAKSKIFHIVQFYELQQIVANSGDANFNAGT